MDAVTSAASAASTTQGATRNSEKAASALSSDFETFLRMLTVQMENQDPLNPIESSDFAVQLATFSGVEQQVRSNDLLESLLSQQSVSALSQIANWVGMEARAAVPAAFDGSSPVTYFPTPPEGADQATLIVKNAAGTEVSRSAIAPSPGPMTWSGTDGSGALLPSGTYSFSVEYRSKGEVVSTNPAEVYAPVIEARLVDGTPTVVFATGGELAAEKISAVRAHGA